MDTSSQNNTYEYYAFISYKREDEKWAKWLQRKLEYYKLPSSVRKDNPDLPEKIRPVFKDTTDLEPGVLAQRIQHALNSSKFLIVICSPRSANSVWVSKEVQSFIDNGRIAHIIPFIIGGTPNASDPKDECFPDSLRQLSGDQELLGANINEMGREAAAIKVIARMFGLRFDSLWQRFERYRKRKNLIFSLIMIISMMVALFMVYLYHDRDRAYEELKTANIKITQERNLVKKAQEAAELSNQHLLHANEKIMQGNLRLQNANDSIRIVNAALIIAQRDLVKLNRSLERTNNDLLVRQSDLLAARIMSIAESGDYPGAVSLIVDNYSYDGTNKRLPITTKSELAIRHIGSLTHQINFVHFNSVREAPFSYMLSELQDQLIGFHEGKIVKYDLKKSEIISKIPCENYESIPDEVTFAGFIDTRNTKLGVTANDSIYVYNAEDGSLISTHRYPSMGKFGVLNDSVVLCVNIFGNMDIVDSRTFTILKSSNIGGLNPIFTQPFKINDKREIIYVDSSNNLICQSVDTGDTIWYKHFDYYIDSEIEIMDGIGAVAVINRQKNVVELFSTEDLNIITSWEIPKASKYQFCSSGGASLSIMTSGRTNAIFDRWVLPYNRASQYLNVGRIFDSKMNYYTTSDSIYYYITNHNEEALFSRTENDGFAIIKLSDRGFFAQVKIENEFRLVYFDFSDEEPVIHIISEEYGENKWDWQHGYANYLYHHQPKSMRAQTSSFGHSIWNQSTDISMNGELVTAALFNRIIYVRNIKSGETSSFEMPGDVFCVKFTPEGKHILIVSEDGVDLYSIEQNSLRCLFNSGYEFCQRPCLAMFSCTSDQLAVGYMDGTLHLYSYPALEKNCMCQLNSYITYFAFNKTGDRIAVILDSDELVVCDTANGEEVYRDIIPFVASNVFFDETGKKIIVHSVKDTMIYPFEAIETVINDMK